MSRGADGGVGILVVPKRCDGRLRGDDEDPEDSVENDTNWMLVERTIVDERPALSAHHGMREVERGDILNTLACQEVDR